MQKYSPEEIASIVHALNLLSEKGFPVSSEIFDAWCGACVTTSIELAVLKRDEKSGGQPKVLMIHREDKFFHGWHIPGTIILPGDTEESAMMRLIKKEVGARVTPPRFADRSHVAKGDGPYQNKRGQEVAILYTCFLIGEYSGNGLFFLLHTPPEDTLGHHKILLEKAARWWD